MLSEDLYKEQYEKALSGIAAVIRECKDPMKQFKKETYQRVFENFHASYKRTYEAVEAVYRQSEDADAWLHVLAGRLAEEAKTEMDACRMKNARTRRQMDMNFALSVYLIPSILKYPAEFSDAFADCILNTWNQVFQTSVGKAGYEEIVSGFRSKLCYITTAVCKSLQKGPDCYELTLLKQFRDRHLEPTEDGHALVEEYYNIAPTIVKRLEKDPDKDRLYQELYLDYLRPCIEMIEAQDYESCGKCYKDMVRSLKERYIS